MGKSCELGEGAWPFVLFNVKLLLGAGAKLFPCLRKALVLHVPQFHLGEITKTQFGTLITSTEEKSSQTPVFEGQWLKLILN